MLSNLSKYSKTLTERLNFFDSNKFEINSIFNEWEVVLRELCNNANITMSCYMCPSSFGDYPETKDYYYYFSTITEDQTDAIFESYINENGTIHKDNIENEFDDAIVLFGFYGNDKKNDQGYIVRKFETSSLKTYLERKILAVKLDKKLINKPIRNKIVKL